MKNQVGRPRIYCKEPKCGCKAIYKLTGFCVKHQKMHQGEPRKCPSCGRIAIRQPRAKLCKPCARLRRIKMNEAWKAKHLQLMRVYRSKHYYKYRYENAAKQLMRYYMKKAKDVAQGNDDGVGSRMTWSGEVEK